MQFQQNTNKKQARQSEYKIVKLSKDTYTLCRKIEIEEYGFYPKYHEFCGQRWLLLTSSKDENYLIGLIDSFRKVMSNVAMQ